MTGIFWLDWALIAVSLFNTMLLLWMGLTVLLNANRRDWGVWLMGGGMLVATVFFISHSAILGQELAMNFDGLNFWWRAGWFPGNRGALCVVRGRAVVQRLLGGSPKCLAPPAPRRAVDHGRLAGGTVGAAGGGQPDSCL